MRSLRARFAVGVGVALLASLVLGVLLGVAADGSGGDEAGILLVVAVAALGTVVAGAVGVGFDRWVIEPLRTLATTAERIGAGDFQQRVELVGYGELGQLAAALNTMASSLEADHAALAELARTLAAEQAALAEAAIRDPLTGLYNARELHRRMQAELSRSDRSDHPLGCMLIDVDHFKRVNDTYGHPVGDEVLKEVAAVISGSVRPADVVARYGGEEFIVLLPDAGDDAAAMVAERVRQAVTDSRIPLPGGGSITVTITVGVATYPRHAVDPDTLISAADRAMYAGKRAGRNRVGRMAQAPPPAPLDRPVTGPR